MTDTATDLPQLLTDAPAKAKEDLLGFQPHADRLAAMLLKQQFPDASFVVGIEGEWGEGKSTFINCLKQRFEQAKHVHGEMPPAVVEFNPWWFENPEKTASNLLETIINSRDQNDKEAIKALEALSAALNHITPWLEKLASNPLVLTALFGANALFATKNAPWLGALVAAGLALALYIGTKWLSRHRERSASLAGLKDKAAAALKSEKMKGQKQIVIIDDLDRLSHQEIREVFRAVKGVLDLPNIVYVIAYDRAIVASALDTVHTDRGDKYLEKIIQYPYVLPKPHTEQYYGYVTTILARTLNVLPQDLSDQAMRSIVNAFLPVPRSVKRLCAALVDFNFGAQKNVDIELIDYLFLESVRFYDADLYVELISALLTAASFPTSTAGGVQDNWINERFAVSLVKLKSRQKIFDCLHYFTGLDFPVDEKTALYSFHIKGICGIPILGTVSVENKKRLVRFVRAYLAKHRDQNEVSRLEVNAFVSVSDKEQFADCVSDLGSAKISMLFHDLEFYSRDWRENIDWKKFSRAWIGFVRDRLLAGEDSASEMGLGEIFGCYLRVFGSAIELELRNGRNLSDILIDFFGLEWGDVFLCKLLFTSDLASRDIFLSKDEKIRGSIVDAVLTHTDLGVMLSVGYFRGAFMDMCIYKSEFVCEWLESLDCVGLSNDKSVIKLSEFISYVELSDEQLEALRRNHSFVTLLRKYQQQLVEMFENPEHHARYARLIAET